MEQIDADKVLRKLTAYQPNTPFDKMTPIAWGEALAPFELADALEAVTELCTSPRPKGETFLVELRHIVAVVSAKRNDRAAARRHLLPDPPRAVAEDPAAYRRWLQHIWTVAAAREWHPEQLEPGTTRPELPN